MRRDSRLRRSVVLLVAFAATVSGLAVAPADPPATTASAATDPRQAEVTAMATAFVDAFQKGDAKALAAFWTPDADYIDLNGRAIKGRDAIAADYAELFRNTTLQGKGGLALRIEVHSLRFPTADTAIEDGVTSVFGPDGTLPSRARYTNTLVKKDGKWLLASVRESPFVPPNHSQHLEGLGWMVGEWAQDGAGPGGEIARVRFDWTPDRNFIVALRAVSVGDALLDAGTERIGWDPAARIIRSWSFEPDGGFSEGSWKRDAGASAETWTSQSSAVLSSGSLMTSTARMTRVDADTVTWQSTNRVIDGTAQPDSPVITMKRVR